MKILLSPSKTMDYSSIKSQDESFDVVSDLTIDLRNALKKLDLEALKTLYKSSDKVAKEAMQMNNELQTFKAICLFNGAVFKNLDYTTLKTEEKNYIESYVCIFSALYGLVPANSGISPYRLDLNNVLEPHFKNLTQKWKEPINRFLKNVNSNLIIDLASVEYRKLIDHKTYDNYYKIDFKDKKGDSYKTVGTYAKMARGQFVRAMAQNKVKTLEDIMKLSIMNYTYNSELSTHNHLIFSR